MKFSELTKVLQSIDPDLKIESVRTAISSSKKRIKELKNKIKEEKELQKTLLGK